MGKDPNEKPERNVRRGLNRRGGETADWASADGSLLQRAICAAAKTRGALRFGYSQDGGAYAIGIYGDGTPYTEWVRPSEDIDAFLQDVIDLFEAIADDIATASNGQKQASKHR